MTSTETRQAPRLKVKYESEIRDRLKAELGVDNVMQVPRFEKIVVNMGVGRAAQQPSLLEAAVADLTLITGQKPLVTKAGKSHRRLQAPRGSGHRRQGDAARRSHVGVLRPPPGRRHPPHP